MFFPWELIPSTLPPLSKVISLKSEIEPYLQTGDHDAMFVAWPGDLFARCRKGEADLRRALEEAVEERAAGYSPPPAPPVADLVPCTRRKVEPMVRGLFPRPEQGKAIALLELSVVFLTRESLQQVLREATLVCNGWKRILRRCGRDRSAACTPPAVG